MNPRFGKDTIWQKQKIFSEQITVKKEIDAIHNNTDRLDHILNQIIQLQPHNDPLSQLRRYIYVVSALVHHRKAGGLTGPQIKRLSKLGQAILATQRIVPTSSKLSFLYGDLHLAVGNIYRLSGHHWKAAWAHHLGHFLSRRDPTGGAGFQKVILGSMALRMGHVAYALDQFNQAEHLGLDNSTLSKMTIQKIKAYRLSHQYEFGDQLCQKLLSSHTTTEIRTEVDWENMCMGVQKTGNVSPLIESLLRDKALRESSYLLESFLWMRSTMTRKFMNRFPSVSNLCQRLKVQVHKRGPLYEMVQVLERCYDTKIALTSRLNALGNTIAESASIDTIDKELLLWASAIRFLARTKQNEIGQLVLQHYQTLCMKLTGGLATDTLGLLGDLCSPKSSPFHCAEPAVAEAA